MEFMLAHSAELLAGGEFIRPLLMDRTFWCLSTPSGAYGGRMDACHIAGWLVTLGSTLRDYRLGIEWSAYGALFGLGMCTFMIYSRGGLCRSSDGMRIGINLFDPSICNFVVVICMNGFEGFLLHAGGAFPD